MVENKRISYTPQPINTDDIVLPKELNSIIEILAENVHDTWAIARLKDGWTYGVKRDDVAKTHPCLVPYTELSESEKSYDRITATQTIKIIIKSGFKISNEADIL